MKKLLSMIVPLLVVLFILLTSMGVIVLNSPHVACVFFGSRYARAGETECTLGGRTETLAIYKAYGKPFLIVGPCRFCEGGSEYTDFFFVNRDQVIRTATDKGGDIWFRFAWQLFILDDMSGSGNDRIRAPYWDDLACDPGSSVTRDEARGVLVYKFAIDDGKTPVFFAIPEKLYTSDMLSAVNDTRRR